VHGANCLREAEIPKISKGKAWTRWQKRGGSQPHQEKARRGAKQPKKMPHEGREQFKVTLAERDFSSVKEHVKMGGDYENGGHH